MTEPYYIQRYRYDAGGRHDQIVLRSTTKNILDPSPAQIEQRLRMAESSHEANGKKMEPGDPLPPAALAAQERIRGPTGLAKPRKKHVWEYEMELSLRQQMSDEEAEAMAKRIAEAIR